MVVLSFPQQLRTRQAKNGDRNEKEHSAVMLEDSVMCFGDENMILEGDNRADAYDGMGRLFDRPDNHSTNSLNHATEIELHLSFPG